MEETRGRLERHRKRADDGRRVRDARAEHPQAVVRERDGECSRAGSAVPQADVSERAADSERLVCAPGSGVDDVHRAPWQERPGYERR